MVRLFPSKSIREKAEASFHCVFNDTLHLNTKWKVAAAAVPLIFKRSSLAMTSVLFSNHTTRDIQNNSFPFPINEPAIHI